MAQTPRNVTQFLFSIPVLRMALVAAPSPSPCKVIPKVVQGDAVEYADELFQTPSHGKRNMFALEPGSTKIKH